MRSTGDQQLFKAMSNRTRAKPQDIYSKLSTHLSKLKDQVSEFNKVEEIYGCRINRQIKRPSSRQFRLKTLTEPKYQNLLLNCELLNSDKNSPKTRKLVRRFSTKSGKQFKSAVMESSLTSFIGFRSNAKSKLVQSKVSNAPVSKIKNKTDLQSTLMNTLAQNGSQFMPGHPQRQINMSITESVVFPNQNENTTIRNKRHVKTVKEMLVEKQKILENEWTKTERYRQKISSCLGQDDIDRLQSSGFNRTKFGHVIDKIKKSRPTTSHCTQDWQT